MLELANDEWLNQAMLHLVYSAKVDYNTNFRPAFSGESGIFFFAIKERVILAVEDSPQIVTEGPVGVKMKTGSFS